MSEHPVAPTRAQHAAGMMDYMREGERLAGTLGNRGPLRRNAQGEIHRGILDAFFEHGFYVFEGVIDRTEIDALRADVDNMIERAPVRRDAKLDARGGGRRLAWTSRAIPTLSSSHYPIPGAEPRRWAAGTPAR
jgi:hypothetical protein